MASIVLSGLGSSVGNSILPGIGGRVLSSITRRAGQAIDRGLGWQTGGPKDGPRLENLRVQDSRYGNALAKTYGSVRVAGNFIWASNLIETPHETAAGGGKGGGVGGILTGKTTRTTYTYSVHCAVAIGLGPIGGVQTIWADSKVIYQDGKWKEGVVATAVFHSGEATQQPDDFLHSVIGEDVPAYKGIAYMVFENLQLSNFGNRLPNLTFEVMPAELSAQPKWLGTMTQDISLPSASLRNGALLPLLREGSVARARQFVLMGTKLTGGSATFEARLMDVTGDVPAEILRSSSAAFAADEVLDVSVAMDAAGQFAACYAQIRLGAVTIHKFVIYESSSGAFGAVYSVNLPAASDLKQIAWIDDQHFVCVDAQSDKRGVRVFLRAGLGCVDRGFYNVWGSGSVAGRVPLGASHFVPVQGGLVHFTANASPAFSQIWGVKISFGSAGLQVGVPYSVASGLSTGSYGGPQILLLNGSNGEKHLFLGTLGEMRMMTFVPREAGAEIIRPWQTITNSVYGLWQSHYACLRGNRLVVAQRSSIENFYRISEIALQSDHFELASDAMQVANFDLPLNDFCIAGIDGNRLLLVALAGYDSHAGQIAILQRRFGGTNLATVVADLLERAGYLPADYDVAALADVSLDGYALPNVMSAAQAMADLQSYFPFTLAESDGVLVAKPHGIESVATIPAADRAAGSGDGWSNGQRSAWVKNRRGGFKNGTQNFGTHSSGATAQAGNFQHGNFLGANRQGAGVALDTPVATDIRSHMQELALPLSISVEYLDASRDYEAGSQTAKRQMTRGAKSHVKISLPLVCTAARARAVAENLLRKEWGERDYGTFMLARRWAVLDIGDVVTVEGRFLRVMNSSINNGVMQISGPFVPMADSASIGVTAGLSADAGQAPETQNLQPVATKCFLMDLPLLRTTDDEAGMYVAASGGVGWQGASLWRAADGVNFSRMTDLNVAVVCGVALAALAAPGAYAYMDFENFVDVQLLHGSLASCTQDELLAGANAARLGGEILQFRTATLLGPSLYRLSGLLRARRGTEAGLDTHQAGEDFVLLSAGGVQFLSAALADKGRNYSWRIVPQGDSLGNGVEVGFVYGMQQLKPLSPVHVRGRRAAGIGTDLTISWKRRARRDSEWMDGIEVPLDETAELYDVEILNGTQIVRTFSGVTQNSVVYSGAQQAADWASIPPNYDVRVMQLSDRYGRGEMATASA